MDAGKYPVGTKIYNRGDMANPAEWCIVAGFKADKWGRHYTLARLPDSDGASVGAPFTIEERSISEVDNGNGSTRFVTETAYDMFRAEQMKLIQEYVASR